MNYRHAYHAGNHADVLKHIVLTRVLVALGRKDKPYRVIDAHAGIGVYALDGVEAGKTREWEGGVGKMAAPFTADVEALLAPWREIVATLNPGVSVPHAGSRGADVTAEGSAPAGTEPPPKASVAVAGEGLGPRSEPGRRPEPGSPEPSGQREPLAQAASGKADARQGAPARRDGGIATGEDAPATASPDATAAIRLYPGSPEIAARMMRAGDRLIANELHPEDGARLAAHFRRDRRVTVTHLDAATSVKATLPPPERRGLVLIDPPYEERGETAKAARMLAEGLARFAGGVFLLWYPIKGRDEEAELLASAKALGRPGTLVAELRVREPFAAGGLAGSGVIVVGAPWRLDDELAVILPALAARLGLGRWGDGRAEWLVAAG